MRKSHNDTDFLFDGNGRVIGINLGWDFTAEHEWGIAGIQKAFGMPSELTEENAGYAYRKISSTPPRHLALIESEDTNKKIYLVYSRHLSDSSSIDRMHNMIVSDFQQQEVYAAWSDSDFGICVPAEHEVHLKRIFKAFQEGDVVIFLGGKSAWGNAGLHIAIYSDIPDNFLKQARESDLDSMAMLKKAKETGIEDRLKKAGKKWYALSPRWKDDNKKDVVFWLNPMDQQNINCGWFSVKDLDDWIADKGPVPKNKAA